MEVISAKRLVIFAVVCLLLPLTLLMLPRPQSPPVKPAAPAPSGPVPSVIRPLPGSKNPWTLGEARAALRSYPDNSYLQFVVLQLAHEEKRLAEVLDDIPRFASRGAGKPVELFGLFTSTDTLQQRLQLETMLAGQAAPKAGPFRFDAAAVRRKRRVWSFLPAPPIPYTSGSTGTGPFVPHPEGAAKERPPVALADLAGPDLPEPSWPAPSAGGKPSRVSPLSQCVPHDFYLAEFRALGRLLAALDAGRQWTAFLGVQAEHDATDRNLRRRVQAQLVFEPDAAEAQLIEQVAVTGSDPFLAEGSDVTLLLRLKSTAVVETYRGHAERAFRRAAEQADAWGRTGQYQGITYRIVTTPDRRVSAYAATLPGQRLHVRSNSPAGLHRVLAAVLGKDKAGRPVRRLGDAGAFRHVRTVLPLGDNEEDGLVYLPGALLRRLLGPAVQLTEARRLIGYNHLRMIAHAAALYRTQFGKAPTALAQLSDTGCAPAAFNQGVLASPFGGTYKLSADGTFGICTVLGTADFLTPCCELPLAPASADEAEGYREFAKEFSAHGSAWVAPVALRLLTGPRQVRAEALVLTPPAGTVRAGLARWLGGAPEPLDALPVPRKSIASVSLRLDRERWVRANLTARSPRQLAVASEAGAVLAAAAPLGFPARVPWLPMYAAGADGTAWPARPALAALEQLGVDPARVRTFVERGIGSQAGLHFYDAAVTFDLSLPALLAELGGAADAGELGELGLLYELGFFAGTLSNPAYLAVPVKDKSVVDDFLAHLDAGLARTVPAWRDRLFGTHLQGEFYRLQTKSGLQPRALGLRAGPARYRLFWARIGDGLYLANQPAILDDLQAAYAQRPRTASSDRGPAAHALLKLRPAHWSLALPGFRLGWAEANREACHGNLALLSAAARAYSFTPPVSSAAVDLEGRQRLVLKYAAKLYGRDFACPDDGAYRLTEDGKSFACTVHGSAAQPRQPDRPVAGSTTAQLIGSLTDATATLTLTQDGLRVVLTISRK